MPATEGGGRGGAAAGEGGDGEELRLEPVGGPIPEGNGWVGGWGGGLVEGRGGGVTAQAHTMTVWYEKNPAQDIPLQESWEGLWGVSWVRGGGDVEGAGLMNSHFDYIN